MALCTKHAVAQLNTMKQRTGKFMCTECNRANRVADEAEQTHKPGAAKPAAHHAPAAHAPAATPKPAAPAPKPAAPAPKPSAPAPATKEFKLEETGPIEFTPEKKK
jgi:hypothetical protein